MDPDSTRRLGSLHAPPIPIQVSRLFPICILYTTADKYGVFREFGVSFQQVIKSERVVETPDLQPARSASSPTTCHWRLEQGRFCEGLSTGGIGG